VTKVAGSSFTNNTSNQPDSRSVEQTPDSNSGEQTFFDYTLNSIKYLNDKVSQKFDLSKSLSGLIIHKRIVSVKQASDRSNETFIKSLTKDKQNKIWEYFVFVPEISDSIPAPTIEQVDIYAQMMKVDSDFKLTSKEAKEPGSMKKLFDDEFPTEQKSQFIKKMENYLLSAIRFYGVSSSGPGNGIRKCKVLFHDPKNLQFGKMVKVEDVIDHDFSLSLKARIRDAKRDLGIKPASAETDKKRKQKNDLYASRLDKMIEESDIEDADASAAAQESQKVQELLARLP